MVVEGVGFWRLVFMEGGELDRWGDRRRRKERGGRREGEERVGSGQK